MPNPTFRRWTADDIAKLKNMAQKRRPADIAAQLGRSISATAVKAHQLNVSLRMPRGGSEVSATDDLAPPSDAR
jgi:hypothetical protein